MQHVDLLKKGHPHSGVVVEPDIIVSASVS
jgi:hypothetical protein